MAGCASARACATPTSPMTRPSASASRRSLKRSSPAHPLSCAMPRPSAATCCNARAAPISTTRRAPATSGSPARAATRVAARTACTRCWAGVNPASPRTHPISACRSRRSTPWSKSRGRRAGARACWRRANWSWPFAYRAQQRGSPRTPATSSSASAPPTPSRWSPPQPACTLRTASLPRRGWRWAAWRPSHGVPEPRRRRWPASARIRSTSGAPQRRRWRRPARPATTPSRSSSLGGSRYARWPSPRPERPSACPPSLPLPSHPFPEAPSMAETLRAGIGPQRRHGASIGQPLTRRDGFLKVNGQARYAADNHPPGMLHAVLAVSSITRGRVTFHDVTTAKAHPGVVEVMTPANRPPLALDPDAKLDPFMFRLDLLQNDRVRYAGQPIAVVIAETLEAATEAATRLSPRYEAEPPRIGLDGDDSFIPPAIGPGYPPEVRLGDAETGLTAAEHRIEAIYETQAQYHNAMEPHAIVAVWDGDCLTVDTPSQGLAWAQARIAGLFGIPPENILIRSPFLGGGFGAKGMISGPQVLGILAARLVGRPVKLVLRREQMYGPVGHRAPTRQTLRLGTDRQGALTAIHHHMRTATSSFDDFFEPSVQVSHTLYASPAIATTAEAVRRDTGTPLFMRAPGEASGSIALESAIDEMAQAAGLDPLEFRLRNYAEVEQVSGKPFSSTALRECYAQGAARFGWQGRPLAPRQMRDENGLLVGWGLGTATFPAIMFQGQARAVLRRDGTGLVELGAQDMGQGAWTALAQIAADSPGP